jgi:hypothetical protein
VAPWLERPACSDRQIENLVRTPSSALWILREVEKPGAQSGRTSKTVDVMSPL